MMWETDSGGPPPPEEFKNDFQTPPPVCNYMASLIPPQAKTILEPTPGRGNLVRAVQSAGFPVTAADDFWDLDFKQEWDCVVCNLPFSGKTFYNIPDAIPTEGMTVYYKALGKLLAMTGCMIVLCPWFTVIDSDSRLRSLIAQGLKSVTHLPRKTFGYCRIQVCVVVVEKSYSGAIQFNYFNPR